jgi:hypothetical protein
MAKRRLLLRSPSAGRPYSWSMQAVHAPLRHFLVVRPLVPRVVQRHPEAASAVLLPLRLLVLAVHAVRLGHAHAHRRAQGPHACTLLFARCSQQKLALLVELWRWFAADRRGVSAGSVSLYGVEESFIFSLKALCFSVSVVRFIKESSIFSLGPITHGFVTC